MRPDSSLRHRAEARKALCPPRNNSLLLFECMPHSFHALKAIPDGPQQHHSLAAFRRCQRPAALARRYTPAETRVRPVCLITGASGKLGTALTRRISSDAFGHMRLNRHEPVAFSQLRQRLETDPEDRNEPYAVQADLRNAEDQRRLVEVALARHGRVDVSYMRRPILSFTAICSIWHSLIARNSISWT